jgi:3-isopropylmalate dehydrogenase
MAMLLTAKLMLDWLGEKDDAVRLEAAVAKTIAENKIGTYDVKGRGKGDSTMAVAEEVARNL